MTGFTSFRARRASVIFTQRNGSNKKTLLEATLALQEIGVKMTIHSSIHSVVILRVRTALVILATTLKYPESFRSSTE